MKKLIRLTESDLHRIVKESVRRILREDFVSPLDRVRNDAPQAIGQIKDFDRNEGYIQVGNEWIPFGRAKMIAREKLIAEIQNGVDMGISTYGSDTYGYIGIETEDGWLFEADSIPVDIEVESWSYYRPATRWEPEESEGPQGYIDSIDFSNVVFECTPPGKNGKFNPSAKSFDIKVDDELRQLLEDNCDMDEIDITEALGELEADYLDYMEGMRSDASERD